MQNRSDSTTVRITRITRNRIASLGRKDDTFEDILVGILKKMEEKIDLSQ